MVFFSRREAEVLFDEHIRSTIKTSLIDLEDGSFGWYRDLSRNDTVGIVATAQMLSIISCSYDFDVEVINKAIVTLLNRQNADGSWPFISNISDVGVVDSTAIVLLSLKKFNDYPGVENAVLMGLNWLEENSNENGWGIVRGSEFRIYSTSLALQALYAYERVGVRKFRHAIGELISRRDKSTFLWSCNRQTTSSAISAVVIYTLLKVSNEKSDLKKAEISAAALYNRIQNENLICKAWENEEVELYLNSERKRIEYKHYTLPLVMLAFIKLNDRRYDNFLFKSSKSICDFYTARDFDTSWEVHDIALAIYKVNCSLEEGVVGVRLRDNREVFIKENDSYISVFLKDYKFFIIMLLALFLISGAISFSYSFGWLGNIFSFILSVAASYLANYIPKRKIQ